MKAAFKSPQGVGIREIPAEAPAADEVRIRVEACGICGTDLSLHDAPAEGGRFGHEMVGTVLELGRHVRGLEVGQRVAIDSATPCGRCPACRDARQELCADIQSFFFTGRFGFAEEACVPAVSAMPCAGLDPAVASLQEPRGVAIDLVRLVDLTIASNVLVLGAGPIGLMAVALARRAGVRRLFVGELGSRPRRLEVARQFGADEVFDPEREAPSAKDFGCAIDRVLVTAPPPALPGAFAAAAKGGIVSFIGIGHGEGAFCRFDANAFHFKKLQLRASFASPALFGNEALRCLREGVVDGPALVSHRFPLADIACAMDVARADAAALKVVITPGGAA
jgi:L-iditol 2-dehydrogenase